jgi:hypothetical protein
MMPSRVTAQFPKCGFWSFDAPTDLSARPAVSKTNHRDTSSDLQVGIVRA